VVVKAKGIFVFIKNNFARTNEKQFDKTENCSSALLGTIKKIGRC